MIAYRARNEQGPRSDVDLAVLVDQELSLMEELRLRAFFCVKMHILLEKGLQGDIDCAPFDHFGDRQAGRGSPKEAPT